MRQKKGNSQQHKDLATDPEYEPEPSEEQVDDDDSDNDSEDGVVAAEIAPVEEHPKSTPQAPQEKPTDATICPTPVQTRSKIITVSTFVDSQTPS